MVHRTLHSLSEKGIVTYVLEGKKKVYSSVNPKLIIDFIDDKKKKYESILPELLAKQNTAKIKPEATIFRGIRGIKELLSYMIENKKSEYFSYGGSLAQQEKLEDYFWEQFHKKRIKNKINSKIIFQPSLRKWGEILNKKSFTQIKFTRKELEPLQETIICGRKIAIIIYTEKPYGFLIEDSIVSNSYKKFFEILWQETKI